METAEIIHSFYIKDVNLCHAECFYALHSSPIFILLTCSIPVVSIYFQLVENSVAPDQMASSDAS